RARCGSDFSAAIAPTWTAACMKTSLSMSTSERCGRTFSQTPPRSRRSISSTSATSDAASNAIRIRSPSGSDITFATMAPRLRGLPAKQVVEVCANLTYSAFTRREAHMKHRLSSIVGALIGACISQAAQAQDLITLRYGQNAAGVGGLSSLPLNVAQRKDYFRREGVNLLMVPIPGGTDRIVAALDKGEIDAGKNATPYLIQAVLKGSDAVAFI